MNKNFEIVGDKVVSLYEGLITLDLKHELFNNNNNDTIDFKLNNKEPLEILFVRNNIDYKKINYIVFSIPKSASSNISLHINNIKQGLVLGFHSIIELIYLDIGFIHYTIGDVINFIASNTIYDQILIFSSYRHPLTRIISKYYWNLRACLLTQDTEVLNNISSDILNVDYDIVYNIIFKKELGIKFKKIRYNKNYGLGSCTIGKKKFIFTCLEDINIFYKNLFRIGIPNNDEINIINENTWEQYKNNTFEFNEETKKYLLEKEKTMIKFYKY